MAMTLFLAVNGISVVFLLYVLAKFWREGHRYGTRAQSRCEQSGRQNWSTLTTNGRQISENSVRRGAVIPFQPKPEILRERPNRGAA
jgi:hypothetical protein